MADFSQNFHEKSLRREYLHCPECGRMLVRQYHFTKNVYMPYCQHCHMFVVLDGENEAGQEYVAELDPFFHKQHSADGEEEE